MKTDFNLQLFAEETAGDSTADTTATETQTETQETDSVETTETTNNETAEQTTEQKTETTDTKNSEEKPADKTTEQVADFSKINVPEGFEQPSNQFIEYAKANGFNREQVQGLVDFYTTQLAPAQEAAQAMQIKQWAAESTKRFGQEQIDSAKQALKDLSDYQEGQKDNEIMNFINESGVGSHPAFIALMSKIGSAMEESTLLQSNIAQSKSGASLLFGQPNSI